ncbi:MULTISPECIES: peptide chain release factor 2 [Anaerostipes]|uniref:peptide chain release factor 2 n=1 Tax=Anaerostipes TaxID=207244 RepID=UPI000952401B|nr:MULTISPECIES: peptide chain release factor 2 [unclassified Anaerostipes]MCI5622229.1 peptide chain release factor 2 [Anaerostipes sp.]MDY2725660.1 peptide chain release factor 2 [Anaerostipes faecalis]OLR59975.1 peptide chain release factor 2 [Anaerostipes sp. 494a]
MIELEQLRYTLNSFREPLETLSGSLALEAKRERIDQLELSMEEPGFWDDIEESQKVMKEIKSLKSVVEDYEDLKTKYEDVETLLDMAQEDEDEELVTEAEEIMKDFEKQYESLRISTLLTGEYDKNNAILTLHAGAGGTESCDWANMLYRMFTRWAVKKGYSTEVIDYLDGDEAGLKSVTVEIKGENAYGYLRSERGVHRLVRISPFNAAGKRQTSFASCDVMPEIEDDLEVEIADEDIRIDTYRASGAGGQHINKTDSAIRITHLPTGIVVQCQNERSQHKNKDQAMKMLKTKLFLLKEQQHLEKLSDIRGDVTDNGWGSQIRSYVLQPYTMVKDHRTNQESGNPTAVLDGDLDDFMNAYLSWDNQKEK